ncbi:hypothetical protein JCM19055_2346 [Geomicrobium sp. JCM 19055]|nr:hypothetical protein JCM19055_2346 [Geomicrobium sp. JCM 19055]
MKNGLTHLYTPCTISQTKETEMRYEYQGDKNEWEQSVRPFIAAVITDEMMANYETDWLARRINRRFNYCDPSVLEHVIECTKAILSGEHSDIPEAKKNYKTNGCILRVCPSTSHRQRYFSLATIYAILYRKVHPLFRQVVRCDFRRISNGARISNAR